jgi:hypothetical protein
MGFGFPPSAEQARFFELAEKDLAVVIKHTLSILEWGIVNRSGRVLEAKGDGFNPEKIMITLRDRGGVHAKSSSQRILFPHDGGKNSRNLQLFFSELEKQVKMFQKNRKV